MKENLISMEIHRELGAINKRVSELAILLRDAQENLKEIKKFHAEKETGEKVLTTSTIHHMKLEDELTKEIREYEKEIARLEERKAEMEDKLVK